jgi:hypothetical protein
MANKADDNNLCPVERHLKRYWSAWLIFILGFALINLLVYYYSGELGNPEKAGAIGSFISGYIGTIIALGGVIMLIVTLQNQIQKDKDEGFERRFFQLLDYHRQITSEIELGDRAGTRVFVKLVDEFRVALNCVDESCKKTQKQLTQLDRINIAYLAFYYGTGENSTPTLRKYLECYDKELIDYLIQWIEDKTWKQRTNEIDKFGYTPLDGHQSRLGHYFRNLYQIVCYVDEHGNHERRLEFAGLLRGQLSNHEQALLCLNSISTLGKAWRTKGFIETYDMIKNIPPDFFSQSGIDVTTIYRNIDWEYKKHCSQDLEPNRDIR